MDIYTLDDFQGNEEIIIEFFGDFYKSLENLPGLINFNYLLIITSLTAFIMFECCYRSQKKYLLVRKYGDDLYDKVIV
tara:strand:+ start:5 stop:238 length:234 start_codon:yes stop_codon:yes gene_type:complete